MSKEAWLTLARLLERRAAKCPRCRASALRMAAQARRIARGKAQQGTD